MPFKKHEGNEFSLTIELDNSKIRLLSNSNFAAYGHLYEFTANFLLPNGQLSSFSFQMFDGTPSCQISVDPQSEVATPIYYILDSQ